MIKKSTMENTRLPAGWEMKTLGDLSEVITKGTTPTSVGHKFVSEGINFIKVESISLSGNFISKKFGHITEEGHNTLKRSQLKNGDILFSIAGALGRTAIVNEVILPANTNQALAIIRLKEDSTFLNEYILSTLKSGYTIEQVENLKGGVAQQNLSLGQIKSFQIPLPPLPQQKQIVAILDKAFAAIDTAKANAAQNLLNAKELFESYLQNIFENKGDDWEEKKWGELCHFVRGPFGGSLKKSMFKESGYVVYEQKHAIHNHFNQLRYFIDEEKFNEMKRFEVKPGDIIMSCSGVTLGRVAIIPDNIPQGIINQALLKLTPNKEINVEFLKHWLRSNIFQTIIFEHSGGAAIPNVPAAKILKEIIIPIPNIKEQKIIVSEIELTLNQTKKLEAIYTQKLADLEEMKKSVLQKAFSGQLNTIN